MSLADTSRALGAVVKLLSDQLLAATGTQVSIGSPDQGSGGPRFNLFLYEAVFDPHLKNVALSEGQTPLWLILRFLITPFDGTGATGTLASFRLLGGALRGLQSLNYLRPRGLDTSDQLALLPNPEPLKITFVEASVELLSKLSGADERYRFSMAFEVRPVLVAAEQNDGLAPLVGIDLGPPLTVIGRDGVVRSVTPSLSGTAISLSHVEPASGVLGDTLTIHGEALPASLTARLGSVELPTVGTGPNSRTLLLDPAVITDDVLSAGDLPLAVYESLPGGRRRPSTLLVFRLRPTLTSVSAFDLETAEPSPAPVRVRGRVTLSGTLLGRDRDDVVVALYREGEVTRLFDDVVDPDPSTPGQRTKQVTIGLRQAVPPGTYRVIHRVNGVQPVAAPELDLTL